MTDTTPSTTHVWPDAATDRTAEWAAAVSFETFLAAAVTNADLWNHLWKRAAVAPDVLARVAAVPGTWRLLVLNEDWCGDASNTVPVLARLAERAPTLELRTLGRDAHLDLMDEHLTNGRSRSIPVVILLDAAGRERAWWGPRPGALQDWVLTEGQALDKGDRYREVRKWYARDRGQTTLDEVIAMIEAAAATTEASS